MIPRGLWFGYLLFLWTALLVCAVALVCMVAAWLRRQRRAEQTLRNLAALRTGWTDEDDRRVAALLRDGQ